MVWLDLGLNVVLPDNWRTLIGLVGRVFANGSGDLGSIPGRVIPKTLKMVLDTSLLNTQQYKVRINGKVEQSRKEVAPPLLLGLVDIEKGTFKSPSTTVAKSLIEGFSNAGALENVEYLLFAIAHWSTQPGVVAPEKIYG